MTKNKQALLFWINIPIKSTMYDTHAASCFLIPSTFIIWSAYKSLLVPGGPPSNITMNHLLYYLHCNLKQQQQQSRPNIRDHIVQYCGKQQVSPHHRLQLNTHTYTLVLGNLRPIHLLKQSKVTTASTIWPKGQNCVNPVFNDPQLNNVGGICGWE